MVSAAPEIDTLTDPVAAIRETAPLPEKRSCYNFGCHATHNNCALTLKAGLRLAGIDLAPETWAEVQVIAGAAMEEWNGRLT